MIPPQVNGATRSRLVFSITHPRPNVFPMIPPQVNGATKDLAPHMTERLVQFPMIPPQVNGATMM